MRKDLWNLYEITFQFVKDTKNVPMKKVKFCFILERINLTLIKNNKQLTKVVAKKNRRKNHVMGRRSETHAAQAASRRSSLVSLVEHDSIV